MKRYPEAVLRPVLSLFVASTALIIASSAISQEAAGPEESQGARGVEEIVVTARKRAESLQDAPLTVSAFSSEAMERYNTDRMVDLAAMTPGLTMTDTASLNPIISIRGVSTAPVNPSADQSVALVFDGVPVNHGSVSRVSQIDMQQVEILKGPQTLFYGKNSPGGVISYTTADPGDEFEMSLKTGYELEAKEHYTEAKVSGPVSEALGARLVVNYYDMDGWLSNYAVGNPAPGFETSRTTSRLPQGDELFLRGTLVFEPNYALRMRTKVSYNDLDQTPYSNTTQNISCSAGTSLLAGEECDADDRTGATTLARRLVDQVPGIRSQDPVYREKWLMASHQIDWQINDEISLTSLTGYLDAENETNFEVLLGSAGGFGVDNDMQQEALSQEFRVITSFDGAVNFAGGLFYANYENTSTIRAFVLSELFGFPGGVIPFQPDEPHYTVESDALSIFGEVMWDISDTLQVSAGVRWSDEDKDFRVEENGAPVTDIVNKLSFDNTSPEITLSWHPTDNATYYVSYKEGFKSGGFNSTLFPGGFISAPGADVSFLEETLEGFELGAKWDLLEGRARLNAAVYSYEIEDLQASTFDSNTISQRFINSGKASSSGAEVDITFVPAAVDGLTLSLGASFLNAEFDEFEAQCYFAQTAAQGCVTLDAGLRTERRAQDFSGRTLVYAPDVTLNSTVNYMYQMANGWSLTTTVSLEYSDEFVTGQTQDPRSVQDSYTRVNANVTLAMGEQWEFSLIGVNLTDEYLLGSVFDATFTGGVDQAGTISRGRQISLQAKWMY